MDISVEHVIHAAPEKVARIMFDPAQERAWNGVERAAEVISGDPLAVGGRVRHDASLLGATIHFVTEVTAYDPGHKLEMDIVEGPAEGHLAYEVVPTAGGAIAIIHLRSKHNLPRSTWARRHQLEENLARLAQVVARSQGA